MAEPTRCRIHLAIVPLVATLALPSWAPAATPPSAAAPRTAAAPPAPAPGGGPLERAARLYAAGGCDEAVELLRAAVAARELTGADVERADVLVARCLIQEGREHVGREIFKGVLRRNPGYRPLAGEITAEEARVFADAIRDHAEEEAVAAAERAAVQQREPARVSVAAGIRNPSNQDIQSLLDAHGGRELRDRIEWCAAVRVPAGSRTALQFEVGVLEQKSVVSYPFFNFDARVRAVPVVASLYWRWSREEGGSTQLFVGAGPIVAGELELTARPGQPAGSLLARETGTYAHAGLERDVSFGRGLGLSLRALVRLSSTRALDLGPTFGPPGALDVNGRSLSFRGFAVQAALRSAIGS